MTLRDRTAAAAVPYLRGWRYGRTPRVAWPWPKGVRGPAVATTDAERETDCSTLTASILMRAYPDAGWTQLDYQGLQVWDATLPASPVGAAVRVGIGEPVLEGAAETWHLVQGWRVLDPPAGGHAFIVYDRGTGQIDVLESSSIGKIGPRWRTTTWAMLRRAYPAALYLARLRE